MSISKWKRMIPETWTPSNCGMGTKTKKRDANNLCCYWCLIYLTWNLHFNYLCSCCKWQKAAGAGVPAWWIVWMEQWKSVRWHRFGKLRRSSCCHIKLSIRNIRYGSWNTLNLFSIARSPANYSLHHFFTIYLFRRSLFDEHFNSRFI